MSMNKWLSTDGIQVYIKMYYIKTWFKNLLKHSLDPNESK